MAITWDYAAAAHLLRRAGFGAPRKDVLSAVKRGQAKTVASLVGAGGSRAWYDGKGDSYQAGRWWLKRMLSGKAGLREKMTLFWHGHFATSIGKIEDTRLMSAQNRIFRTFAMGNFREHCQAVSRDGAMLIWLDNVDNVKNAPNENYARELMELFTIGITDLDGNPNYTEQDVREAARAFTGWFVGDGVFYFEESEHDFDSKTFRGRTGNFDGTDIVDQLTSDRQCARYLSKKLWEFFAYRNPERQIVEDLADIYLANDTEIAPVLDAIFLSDAFYSPRARTERVSSPVEFAVGAVRTLGTKVRNPEPLPYYMAQMAQELYNPPNVAGWPGHLAWMSSVTRLARMDFTWNVISQRGGGDLVFVTDPVKLVQDLPKDPVTKAPTHAAIVDRIVELIGVSATPQTRADLAEYLGTTEDPLNPGQFIPVPVDFRDRDLFVDIKLRGLVGTVLTLPEAYLA